MIVWIHPDDLTEHGLRLVLALGASVIVSPKAERADPAIRRVK